MASRTDGSKGFKLYHPIYMLHVYISRDNIKLEIAADAGTSAAGTIAAFKGGWLVTATK
jgi:hypothetical protein